MRPGLRLSIAAAPRGVTVARMPAGTGVALLADIPDRECRDGLCNEGPGTVSQQMFEALKIASSAESVGEPGFR